MQLLYCAFAPQTLLNLVFIWISLLLFVCAIFITVSLRLVDQRFREVCCGTPFGYALLFNNCIGYYNCIIGILLCLSGKFVARPSNGAG